MAASTRLRLLAWSLPSFALAACAGRAPSTPVARTVQPGAPGEATRPVDAAGVAASDRLPYVPADVRFMQGMIPHHAQALAMTALVRRHSRDEGIRRMALRMEISQRDEIALMSRWLGDRDEEVPEWADLARPDAGGMAQPSRSRSHDAHGGAEGQAGPMPGMLSPAQMEQLAAARGAEFDRLFLEYMIQHHEGALVMVDELFSAPGGGQESEIFQLASHIDADQRAEIDRMRRMLSRSP